MTLLLRRLKPHLLPPSPPLSLATPFLASISRLLSTTSASTPPPASNPPFAAEYLIKSCGLRSDDAVRASKYVPHLKSPDNPDRVLQFLRQIGIAESDIRAAVSRNARLLCSNVDNSLRPNVAKLQEVGFSMEDISTFICRFPGVFRLNVVLKIDFWLGVLGSVKCLSVALKRSASFLSMSLEKAAVPNLSFLKGQCGLSACQIAKLIKIDPRVVACNIETLKMNAKRAEELVVSRSSGNFLTALVVVSGLKNQSIEARLNHLESCGFSQWEVNSVVRTMPTLLRLTEELIGRKIEFLINETRCGKLHVIQNPCLLGCSLEKRLIPRNLVRNLLKLKELPEADKSFASFAKLSEKQFVERFILPYEHDIPGLHQAYANACAGNMGETQSLFDRLANCSTSHSHPT